MNKIPCDGKHYKPCTGRVRDSPWTNNPGQNSCNKYHEFPDELMLNDTVNFELNDFSIEMIDSEN